MDVLLLLIVSSSRGVAVCRAKKQSYQFAVEDAFRQVILVTVGSDRSMRLFVEVNKDSEHSLQSNVDQDCGSLLIVSCVNVSSRITNFVLLCQTLRMLQK
jgi:hypothetical protein